jgi:hypothetical protein
MASSGFSTDDVRRLREKLNEGQELDREDRERLVAILDAVSAGARAATGIQRTTLTDAEIGNEELRDLLAQLRDAFSPGDNPASMTQINIFSKITPHAEPGGRTPDSGTSGGGGTAGGGA